jgi:hypothetical protein
MFHPAAVGVDGRVNLFVGNVSDFSLLREQFCFFDVQTFAFFRSLPSCPIESAGKTSKTSFVERVPFSARTSL